MDEAWVLFRVCDETDRADVLNLLNDGVVPHRERRFDESDLARSVPRAGVSNRFGAHVPERVVIEVRAADLPRAKQIMATHYEELARAVEQAAGAGIATPEEHEADERWMEARRSKSYRMSKVMVWSLCGILVALAVAVVYLELFG